MKPEARHDWIEAHMRTGRQSDRWDVCDADFVDAYIAATNAPHRPTNYGAYKCPQLGRDLAAMVKGGVLKRARMGIDGMAGMGFPKWVWGYRLAFWIEADESSN